MQHRCRVVCWLQCTLTSNKIEKRKLPLLASPSVWQKQRDAAEAGLSYTVFSIEHDVLLLPSALRREKPLKLVVTSATLDGEKFSKYFMSCPVFHVRTPLRSNAG